MSEIEKMKEKVREEIVLSMRRHVDGFKLYLTDYSWFDSKYELSRDEHYGCKDDNYYYCFFPKTVHFIYLKSHWCSNCIFFDDTIKCWFVYDGDKKKYVTFEALDTDAQIEFLNMLDHFVARMFRR